MGAVGRPKTGGRQKGSLNRKTLFVLDRIEESGFDLVLDIMQTINEITNPSEKADKLLRVLEYCAPKLKEKELTKEEIETPRVTQTNVQGLFAKSQRSALASI